MKKILAIVLCLVVVLNLISIVTMSVSAAGLDQIKVNETWTASWGADIEQKFAYLTVEETGYYDIVVKDLNKTDSLSFYLYDLDFDSGLDLDDEGYTWDNTYVSFYGDKGEFSSKNIYLIAGHLYEIGSSYGTYIEEGFKYTAASISILVTKNNYKNVNLTLGQNKNITIGTNNHEWMDFKTTKAGDYLFKLNQTSNVSFSVFEKVSGKLVDYLDFQYYDVKRLKLKANTEYLLTSYDEEPSVKLVRFKVTKADTDVSSIVIHDHDLTLGHNGYIYESSASLDWNDIENYSYKIKYSNNKIEILSYHDLRYNGIDVYDVVYSGAKHSYNGEYFFAAGKQPVEVVYMNGVKSTSSVYITSYVEWLGSKHAFTDYEDMSIEYENSEEQIYYWKIKPNETNNYEFYSSNWEQISSYFVIFDKNNKVVPYTDGYNLVGGELYSIRVTYTYENDCYGDVLFSLEPHRTHVHSYKNGCDTDCNVCGATRVTKHVYKKYKTTDATTSKNGKKYYECTECGKIKITTIYKASKCSLSTTTYTYNGKTKKPSVKIYDSMGNKLTYGEDYTYKRPSSSKKVGKYTIKVTFKGDYSGTKNLYYTINPPKTSVSSLTAGKKSLKVKLKKQSSQTSGYEIQYSTSKSFKSAKVKKISSYKTTTTTLKSLSSKKTYYVRVRTYKTVNGKKYYSGWSSYKYKKTK